MLSLPIEKKWFDMCVDGIKQDEYRDIKPYWTKRLSKAFRIDEYWLLMAAERANSHDLTACYQHIVLVKYINGYGANRPYFIAKVQLLIGKGKKEWGAHKEVVYIIHILEIVEVKRSNK